MSANPLPNWCFQSNRVISASETASGHAPPFPRRLLYNVPENPGAIKNSEPPALLEQPALTQDQPASTNAAPDNGKKMPRSQRAQRRRPARRLPRGTPSSTASSSSTSPSISAANKSPRKQIERYRSCVEGIVTDPDEGGQPDAPGFALRPALSASLLENPRGIPARPTSSIGAGKTGNRGTESDCCRAHAAERPVRSQPALTSLFLANYSSIKYASEMPKSWPRTAPAKDRREESRRYPRRRAPKGRLVPPKRCGNTSNRSKPQTVQPDESLLDPLTPRTSNRRPQGSVGTGSTSRQPLHLPCSGPAPSLPCARPYSAATSPVVSDRSIGKSPTKGGPGSQRLETSSYEK
jgi:hypothetical protein